jgi:hypothetical protein
MGEEFVNIGSVDKLGFETLWVAESFYQWVRVEAVDGEGNGLRNSSFTGAFVPSAALVGACDEVGCGVASVYSS